MVSFNYSFEAFEIFAHIPRINCKSHHKLHAKNKIFWSHNLHNKNSQTELERATIFPATQRFSNAHRHTIRSSKGKTLKIHTSVIALRFLIIDKVRSSSMLHLQICPNLRIDFTFICSVLSSNSPESKSSFQI